MKRDTFDRRTVLKLTGTSVAGATALSGIAGADDTDDERRQDTFTWADHDIYEMLATEPPFQIHPVDGHRLTDDEGDEEAHEPIWIVGSMYDTGVPGSDHSPHIGIRGHPVLAADHVLTFSEFNPQWHVHFVVDPSQPILQVTFPDGSTGKFPNLVSTDEDGKALTSAERIRNASNVLILETEHVFTCPVRPHRH